MAKKIRFEWISEGFREILLSDKMGDVCAEAGQQIASRATAAIPYEGSLGFEYQPTTLGYGGGRRGGYVAPVRDEKGKVDYLAVLAEANQKVLTKAVQS